MTGEDRDGEEGPPPGRVEALFAEYVRAAKDGVAFDDFLAGHPEQAEALRAVHSLWVAGELAAVDSRALTGGGDSLHAALRALAAPAPDLVRVSGGGQGRVDP